MCDGWFVSPLCSKETRGKRVEANELKDEGSIGLSGSCWGRRERKRGAGRVVAEDIMLEFFLWAVLLAFVRSDIVRLNCSQEIYNASGLGILYLKQNLYAPGTTCNVTFAINPDNITFFEISGASIVSLEYAHTVRGEGMSGLRHFRF